MARILWSSVAAVCFVATWMNTDVLIPVLRGFVGGSIFYTVLGVSILANGKVLLTVTSASRSGASDKVNRFRLVQKFIAWNQRWIRSEAVAIAVLVMMPIPGLRAFCTTWCGVTQSRQGLMALLIANPIHIWSFVWGFDKLLGR